MIKNKKDFPSELRFDVVSKDWVVIAKGRAKKPDTFKKESKERQETPEGTCPFCHIETQEKPTLVLPKTTVIPNKYPAFIRANDLNDRFEGPLYQVMNAVGFHEVVVTYDHKRQLAQFSLGEIKEVLDAYQQRFLAMKKERFVNYISIFHNHGPTAGASISHPHSQIISTPLIDADLRNGLISASEFFSSHKKCVYCEMNEWEKKSKKRIVFENKDFLATCPFASKTAFEVIISPKKHQPYFEEITEKEKKNLAEAFGATLGKIYKGLNDPDYNFYLHTSPCDGKDYNYYHWHWTILPKTSIWAGFEIGARMEISTIEPEKAADYLRKQ